jgi:cyclopropane-fatty-acyl-phospholipid synthase
MSTQTANGFNGASAEAIQQHYDTSNEFFELWLGDTMSYTCALWPDDQPDLDLNGAQRAKIDWHLRHSGSIGADRVLDVGCGWASALNRMVDVHGVRKGVGLTLSRSQADYVLAQGNPKVDIVFQGWADYEADEPFDAIVSIGSFEAYAKPGLTTEAKIESYREYFRRCHRWLKPGGRMTLQTIAYNNADLAQFNPFISSEIFPEQDLPTLADIAHAFDHLFEIETLRNDRTHYARTLKLWLKNLRAKKAEAVALVGETEYLRFERYLKTVCYCWFEIGDCCLYRMSFKRIDKPRGGVR